ncbi:MAG: hypothetical protein HYU02_02095 [Thaumarchaeota archaeon]|nr:hypothetical protein [Nitrososphaerota archaeon]
MGLRRLEEKSSKGKGEEKLYKPHVITADYIAEQGYDPEKRETYYIVYQKETEEITIEPSVKAEGKTYWPLLHQDLTTNQVFLPSKAEEYHSDTQLFKEEEDFLNHWHEERFKAERSIDVAYVAITHLFDVPLPEIPYRRRLATFGKGKSAAGQAMVVTSYCGMLLAGMDSEASIRWTFDFWRGTPFIDEADFAVSDIYSTIMKILNVGFSNLGGWYKSQDPNDPAKVRIQRVFGPKILATRQRWKDLALESRALTAMGYEALNQIPLFRHKQFLEQALRLRNKWLMWRFRNWYRFKELVEKKIEKPGLFEELYGEMPIRNRVKQILIPLGLIASEDLKRNLKTSGLSLEETLATLDEESQYELLLREELKEIANAVKVSEVNEVSHNIGGLKEGWRVDKGILKVPLREISEKFVDEPTSSKTYEGEVSKVGKQLAAILRDRIGVRVKVGTGNKRFVYIDRDLLGALKHANLANYANSQVAD